jgi:hypothetical protein
MTIAPGSRLGPYEVVSRLDSGGIGEVYRAWDTRLGREVAIKDHGGTTTLQRAFARPPQ